MPGVRTMIVAGMATLAIGLVGCGGGGGAAAPAKGAEGGGESAAAVKMEDIKFDKTALSATKGQKLVLNLTNAGALDHDFTIDKIEGAKAVVKAKASGTLEITPSAAGAFEYYCSVAGHKEAGMKGTLTVK